MKTTDKKTKKNLSRTKKVSNDKKTNNTKSKNTTKGKEIMQRMDTTSSKESKKMLIIVCALIAILGVFYLIVSLATGKIKLNETKEVEIQYSEILAGSTFKQNADEYLVLYYDYTMENAADYTSLVSTYTSKEESLTLYTVDLSRKFNTTYIKKDNEESNKNPTTAKELKLSNPTLIKIKDKKVTEYIEGYEEIKNYMS